MHSAGRHLICLGLILALAGTSLAMQPRPEYRGKLNPVLLPNRNFHMTIRFDPLPDSARSMLPNPPLPGEKVFLRKVKWPPQTGKPLAMVLVEPAEATPYLYADVDLDGKFSETERFPFFRFGPNPGPEDELVIPLPFSFAGTRFDKYPVTLRPSAANGESRELSYSNSAFTTGVVQMDGQNVLVQYGIDAMTGRISPEFEGLGIDANGDGRIDFDENSPETDYGNHGEVIFRVGEHYVSTKSIDSSTGVIVLQSRLPSEYHRIELTKGTQIPDFSFIDFGGNTHRFSDYRGKYVLLDFWATWCPPCVAEIPFLKELYDRFRSRNFEIIGMDVETGWDTGSADELKKGVEKGRQFVSQKGINWPQARTDGIAELVNNRFRVNYYPMKLLLDPRGRILLRQGSKGHDDLVEMLSKLLPGK